MEKEKAPHPWLPSGIAIAALVFTILFSVLWSYIQMRHWKDPDADYVAIAINIAVTLVLWITLVITVWRNILDARRAKRLRLEITDLTGQVSQMRQEATQQSELCRVQRTEIDSLNQQLEKYRGSLSESTAQPTLPPYRKELLHISFNYLPQSPLERDWVIAEGTAMFSKASGVPSERAMAIHASGRFAMDRVINDPTVQANCRCIEFSAVIPRGSAFYVGMVLADQQGNVVDSGKDGGIFWIDYVCINQAHPIAGGVDIEDGWTNERAIRVADGWQKFSLNLQEDAGKTYPGLTLRRVARIRVRNSLSISPLWFYAATANEAAVKAITS
jgi:hypothetical protein